VAYVDGMSVGVLVAAGVAVVGGLIALIFLPSQAKVEAPAPVDEAQAALDEADEAGFEVAPA
jgi:hypothetical protein